MIRWRRSSYCGSSACVEVAEDSGRVLVRDSRGDASPVLDVDRAAWQAFLRLIR